MRLFFIWGSNYFWYRQDQTAWIFFLISYYTVSEIVPFTIFCVVLIFRIINYRQDYKVMIEAFRKNNRTISESEDYDNVVIDDQSEVSFSVSPKNIPLDKSNKFKHFRSPNRSPNSAGGSLSMNSDDRTISESSIGGSFKRNRQSRVLDLGPLSQKYIEGNHSRSPLIQTQKVSEELPNLPLFSKIFFFRPV